MSEWFNFSVWKFELPLSEAIRPQAIEIEMPVGATIRAVGCQGSGLFLWAEVPTKATKEKRRFHVEATGGEFTYEGGRNFIGTALMYGGQFVWHVYEVFSK